MTIIEQARELLDRDGVKRKRSVLSFERGGKIKVPVAQIIASPKVQAHVRAIREWLAARERAKG